MSSFCILLLGFFCACDAFADDASSIEQLKKRQQEVLDQQNVQQLMDQKRAMLAGNLERSLAKSLESVYDSLKAQGIKFDDVRPLLDRLNFSYRLAGASKLGFVTSKDEARFAVVSGGFLRDLPIVVPSGIEHLVTLRMDLDEVKIDGQGNVAKDCHATIYRSYLGEDVFGTNLGRYACSDVLNQAHSRVLSESFTKWLLKNLDSSTSK